MPRAPRAAEGGMVHPVLNRGNARASGPFSRPHAAGDLEIWRDVAFVKKYEKLFHDVLRYDAILVFPTFHASKPFVPMQGR